MNPGVIDGFLNAFTTYIDSGFGLLHGEVMYLSSTLIAIDITLAGLFWAWGENEDVMARLIRKTLYIGFFAYIILPSRRRPTRRRRRSGTNASAPPVLRQRTGG